MQLKDDIDFRTLDESRWEELCYQVLHARNPCLETINGSGGDEGIDAYIGDFENPSTIYQFKYFRNGFGKSQKRQVEQSLNRALMNRSGFKWVLICNIDPTADAQRWFERLRAKHPDTEIEFVFGSKFKGWLINSPRVRKEYFPNQQDTYERILSKPDCDPLNQIVASARAYNDIVVDDCFRATITTDGETETIVLEPRPNMVGSIPLFKFRSLTQLGSEALEMFWREGREFELTPNDIEVVSQSNLFNNMDNCESISLRSIPQAKPSYFRFYSSEVPENCTVLVVELRTIREGAETVVRSNIDQAGSPVVFEFEFTNGSLDNAGTCRFRLNMTLQLKGIRVKVAHKGITFFEQVLESRCLGISDADSDFDDAKFSQLGNIDQDIFSKSLKQVLDRINMVCDFFDCNPVINDSFDDPNFIGSILKFSDLLFLANKEIAGSLTFTLENCEEAVLQKASLHEESVFVIDSKWDIDLFGVYHSAVIRTIVKGKLSFEKIEQKFECILQGTIQQLIEQADSFKKTVNYPG